MEAYQPDLGGRHTSMLMGIISVDADFLESLERWEVLIRWYQTVDVVSGATKIVVLMKYAPAALRGALRINASFMGSDYERVNKFMLTGCRAGQSITTSAKQPRPRAHQAGRSQWMLEPSTTKAGRARQRWQRKGRAGEVASVGPVAVGVNAPWRGWCPRGWCQRRALPAHVQEVWHLQESSG